MPEEGVSLLPKEDLLSFEEIAQLATAFAGLGVRRIRLTGGEPTIRKRVWELVERLHGVDGIDELVMTTNGHRLPELAVPLFQAGLRGVNVSIDTLSPEKFRLLTRRGDISRVQQGIAAAVDAGLQVKTNAVALAGTNDDELGALCEYAWSHGALPRFIEHMPMSEGTLYSPKTLLSAAAIISGIATQLGDEVAPVETTLAKGPARYFELKARGTRFGIISAMTDHFCATCNRVRLTATGELHTCLAYDDAVNLRALLRGGASPEMIEAAIRGAVATKRDGHVFGQAGNGGPQKHMVSIGG